MKKTVIIAMAVAAFRAYADSTTAPATASHEASASPTRKEALIRLEEPKDNNQKSGAAKGEVSGIFSDVVKADSRLQMFSPLAPSRYGSAERNLVRDPMDGKSSGLKFFSIAF